MAMPLRLLLTSLLSLALLGSVTASASAATKINFQPSGAAVPSGYLVDSGLTYGNRGNGQTYGWNTSTTSYTRERNVASDQRKDTLITFEYASSLVWEIAVPNGTYDVTLVAGDPQYFDSTHKINLEGSLFINKAVSSSDPFAEQTGSVTVSDGKLRVRAFSS